MADAAVAADVDLVFADLQVTLGGLDVLINNASISGPTVPIESIDAAGWERTVAVNLNSQYYFARRAVPMLQVSPASPCLIAIGPVGGGWPEPRLPHAPRVDPMGGRRTGEGAGDRARSAWNPRQRHLAGLVQQRTDAWGIVGPLGRR
jgi:NAD(P)-dependent dehydrogenase (short-subunit alcohol dehydrogenase family)